MKNKEIIIGILSGLLTTVIGTIIHVAYISFREGASMSAIWSFAVQNRDLASVIAIGAGLNFLAFFGFLKYDKEQKAKGVLVFTIITAVALMIYKLLN